MTGLLIKALKDLLEAHIKGDPENNISPLLVEKQGHASLQPLKVYENFIPSDEKDDAAYPCLVVRWAEAEEEDDFAVEIIDILVCTYSKKGRQISEDWANVVAGRVRSLLRESTLVSSRFKRIRSIKAINPRLNPDEKHFSHHVLTIRSSWHYLLPDITSMEG